MLGQGECFGYGNIGDAPLPYFVCGVLTLLGLFSIAFTLYWRDNTAKRGLKSVDIFLPIYYIPVAYCIFIGLFVGATNIVGLFPTELTIGACKWFLFRLCADGLAIFLMHNGIGLRALRNSVIGGLVWATFSATIPVLMYYAFGLKAYIITAETLLSLVLAFYIILWLAPKRFLHRRPAMLQYAFSNAAIIIIFICTHILLDIHFETTSCAVETLAGICWFVLPFVILQAIRQDSLFWQGLFVDSPHTSSGNNLNQPLLGIWDLGRQTMGVVADSIAHLERKVVPIIPFGFLEVDNSKFFPGGTARVYKGKYRDREVAIKFLFCMELTPERVVDFCDEATLLNSLQHPNVVECLGVTVMPPAMCLITEFCVYGSLFQFLYSSDLNVTERQGSGRSRFNSDSSCGGSPRNSFKGVGGSGSFGGSTIGAAGAAGAAGGGGLERNESNRDMRRSIMSDLPNILEESERGSDATNNSSINSSVAKAKKKKTKNAAGGAAAINGDEDTSTNPLVSHDDDLEEGRWREQRYRESEDVDLNLAYKLAEAMQQARYPLEERIARGGDLDRKNVSTNIGTSSQGSSLSMSQLSDEEGIEGGGGRGSGGGGNERGSCFSDGESSKRGSGLNRESGISSLGASSTYTALTSSTLEKMGFSVKVVSRARTRSNDGADRQAGGSSNSRTLRSSNGGGRLSVTGSFSRAAGETTRQYSMNPLKRLSDMLTTVAFGFGLGPPEEQVVEPSKGKRERGDSFQSAQMRISTCTSLNDIRVSSFLASGHNSRHSVGHIMPLSLRLRMARDCCAGVAYLHSNGIMHCDIKSLNFLVDRDLVVKLSDLGEARPINTARFENVREMPRNINWSAPEVLDESKGIDQSADIWSLALVIAEILTGEVPFDTPACRSMALQDFREELRKGLRPIIPQFIIEHSPWLQDLVQKAWAFEPKDRCDGLTLIAEFEKQISGFTSSSSPRKASY